MEVPNSVSDRLAVTSSWGLSVFGSELGSAVLVVADPSLVLTDTSVTGTATSVELSLAYTLPTVVGERSMVFDLGVGVIVDVGTEEISLSSVARSVVLIIPFSVVDTDGVSDDVKSAMTLLDVASEVAVASLVLGIP